MSINAMIDRATSPHGQQYLVKLFGDVIYGGTFEACKKFVKGKKLPLLIISDGAYAWREFG